MAKYLSTLIAANPDLWQGGVLLFFAYERSTILLACYGSACTSLFPFFTYRSHVRHSPGKQKVTLLIS